MESTKKIKKGQIQDFISDSTQTALNLKQNNLNAINLGQIIFDELAIKSTPSADDEIVMYDSLTGEAVTAKFSSFNGKRTMYLFFPISQNIAASTSWYALPSTGQIFAGTGYTANAALTDSNDFADQPILTPRVHVPFQHKVKSVSVHGRTNSGGTPIVTFSVQSGYSAGLTNISSTVENPLIVAQEAFQLLSNPSGTNGFQYNVASGNLDTSTRNAFTDYRLFLFNNNAASNLLNTMLIVEVEEVL